MISRKFFLVAAMALSSATAMAQTDDMGIFDHMSVGVEIGSTGWGVDLGAPIGNYVQVRAGITSIPDVTLSTDVDLPISASQRNAYQQYLQSPLTLNNIDIEGKVGMTNGKLLIDVYPFRKSSFHITAGAYVGTSKVLKVKNTSGINELKLIYDFNQYGADLYHTGKIGAEVGDYLLTPTKSGVIDAYAKMASVKPYAGIGFGRAVQTKSRIGVSCDLGVMLWNEPEFYCNSADGYFRLSDDATVSGDNGGAIKSLSKLSVYPVLNVRLTYRLF
ncbi:MAG: hypothetical protein MJY90_02400 [Bacteroidaceae bacterium]|nr:hypothetical protein [Bacteroidaceae bacterium]